MQSVDMQNTSSTSTMYKGAPSNSINHDFDQIQIFLGVSVNAVVDHPGHVIWGVDFSQIANRGFAETGYPISVGCLRSNSTISSSAACTDTVNFLSSAGITSADYPNIIGADPFADPSAPLTPSTTYYVQASGFADLTGQQGSLYTSFRTTP